MGSRMAPRYLFGKKLANRPEQASNKNNTPRHPWRGRGNTPGASGHIGFFLLAVEVDKPGSRLMRNYFMTNRERHAALS